MSENQPNVVDLFCGVGGLTKGLSTAGLNVLAGIDFDADCEFAYTYNNKAKFHCRDIGELDSLFVKKLFPKTGLKVLSGCAPCQPFSRYGRGAVQRRSKWSLLSDFARIAIDVRPDVVTMENVPELEHHRVFDNFLTTLNKAGYFVEFGVLHCPDFGVPQSRNRLVLIASLHGSPRLPKPTHTRNGYPTVRHAIGKLSSLKAGDTDENDMLHRACQLSGLNQKRIRASVPGGTWREWPKQLRANCHKVESGSTYPAVYGRMEWDKPSPTITTQFFGYGNGRFGHPEQDRAISLREGALLQSFPKSYRFFTNGTYVSSQKLGQLIGNAVPVRLGIAIGKAIVEHIQFSRKKNGQN